MSFAFPDGATKSASGPAVHASYGPPATSGAQQAAAVPASSQGPLTVWFPFVGRAAAGRHVSASKLIRDLPDTLARPIVVLHETTRALVDLLKENGIEFIVAPAMPLPASARGMATKAWHYLTITVPRLTRLLRELKVDIVH